MKKSIKDLTEKDCIATPTLEDWLAVKKLFPKINLGDHIWNYNREETCIRPLGRDSTGLCSPLEFYKSKGNPIHSLTDFIEYEPQFNPKLGDLVSVEGSNQPRIFLFSNNGVHYCVNINEENEFYEGKSFEAIFCNNIYPYNPPVILTPEQAIEQLQQLPEFSGKEIKIEG